jgi:hypothetical protein
MGADRAESDLSLSVEALDLLSLMRDISQRCWSAGWLVGLEFSLWNMVVANAGQRYGDGEITVDQIIDLRSLHEVCDGWWYWDEELGEERFVSTEQWMRILGA